MSNPQERIHRLNELTCDGETVNGVSFCPVKLSNPKGADALFDGDRKKYVEIEQQVAIEMPEKLTLFHRGVNIQIKGKDAGEPI